MAFRRLLLLGYRRSCAKRSNKPYNGKEQTRLTQFSRTIEQDIDKRLLRMRGGIRMRTIAAGLRSTTADSPATLAAGLRGRPRSRQKALLSTLAAVFPAQRGWAVDAFQRLVAYGAGVDVGLVFGTVTARPSSLTCSVLIFGSAARAGSQCDGASSGPRRCHIPI